MNERSKAWRVGVLSDANAGHGLFPGSLCAFAVPNYWTYGLFEPRHQCELPGQMLRVRASVQGGSRHAYYAPGFEGEAHRYAASDLPFFVAWTIVVPVLSVPGGKYGLVGDQVSFAVTRGVRRGTAAVPAATSTVTGGASEIRPLGRDLGIPRDPGGGEYDGP